MVIRKKTNRRRSESTLSNGSSYSVEGRSRCRKLISRKMKPVRRSSRICKSRTNRLGIRSRTSTPVHANTSDLASNGANSDYKNLYERVKNRVRRGPRDCYHISRYEEVQRQNRYNPFASLVHKNKSQGRRSNGTGARGSQPGRRRRRSRGCLSWMSESSESSEEEESINPEDLISESGKRKPDRVMEHRDHKRQRIDASGRGLTNVGGAYGRDFESVKVDKSLTFDCVGGHKRSIEVLKEMIIFPLLYGDVFTRFKIKPARGVLFHGPPGTGKTLLARALATECSSGVQKVSFFMRKGADCLSKWVGESERQLKMLFDKAYEMRPSIIFFDEIDGLAPIRSSRQDQIHTSIVSTLLALMDGVSSESGVVVIGSTNRLDFIDPALRRPGRFDREFFFGLPKYEIRCDIIKIHTRDWDQKPTEDQVKRLAERTNGFCGADLEALCRDSVLHALRRTFPQVYRTRKRLNLDPSQIEVLDVDFDKVLSTMSSSVARTSANNAVPLPMDLKPLMKRQQDTIYEFIVDSYPAFADTPPRYMPSEQLSQMIYKPRLLLVGEGDHCLSTYVAPAILHLLEANTYTIEPVNFYNASFRCAEDCVTSQFRLAMRNTPSVVYLPRVTSWWNQMQESTQMMIVNSISSLDPRSSVLLLMSADGSLEEIPSELLSLFENQSQIYRGQKPDQSQRIEFFNQIFTDDIINILKDPPRFGGSVICESEESDCDQESLPERKMDAEELERQWQSEENLMMSLRLFLRETLSRFLHDKRFVQFREPVDPAHVSDYYEIIKRPVDLSLIMSKIDKHNYFTVDQFMDDIKLLMDNAILYNPDTSLADREIRHRANHLYDYAQSVIHNELCTESHNGIKYAFRDRLARGAIQELPVSYSLYRASDYDPTGRQSPSVSLSAFTSKFFIRYDPILPEGVRLRPDSSGNCHLEPGDDNPHFTKVFTIDAKVSSATCFFECIPDDGRQTRENSKASSRNEIQPRVKPRKRISPARKPEQSIDPATLKQVKRQAQDMVKKSVEASAGWNLSRIQEYQAAIYSAVNGAVYQSTMKVFDIEAFFAKVGSIVDAYTAHSVISSDETNS